VRLMPEEGNRDAALLWPVARTWCLRLFIGRDSAKAADSLLLGDFESGSAVQSKHGQASIPPYGPQHTAHPRLDHCSVARTADQMFARRQ